MTGEYTRSGETKERDMKKEYATPLLVKRGKMSDVTATGPFSADED